MPEGIKIPDRSELVIECGRSIACINAVEYYIKYMQDPCYPPDRKLTTKARMYFMKLMEKYGRPSCDIRKLVYEALRGSGLESLADEIASNAAVVKRELNVTSRVAAALTTLIVANMRGIALSKTKVAKMFSVSVASINEWKIHNALKFIRLLRR